MVVDESTGGFARECESLDGRGSASKCHVEDDINVPGNVSLERLLLHPRMKLIE